MTPPAQESLEEPQDQTVAGVVVTVAETPSGADWFAAAEEERVVLSPPEGVGPRVAASHDAAGAVELTDIQNLQQDPGKDRPDSEGSRDSSDEGRFVVSSAAGDGEATLAGRALADRSSAHARRVWMIAAALVAGASLAVLLQTMLGRPSQGTLKAPRPSGSVTPPSGQASPGGVVATPAPAVRPPGAVVVMPLPPASQGTSPPIVTPIAASPPVAVLPVVSAVVALLPERESAPEPTTRPVTVAERSVRAHAGHSTVRSNARLTPVHRAGKRTASTWVDPFAKNDGKYDGKAGTTTRPPATPGGTSDRARSTRTTWVDPFAN